MKTTILFILTFVFLSNCSVRNSCKNRFEFISSRDRIPILKFDISEDFDLIRQEINKLYKTDLCEKCSLIEFKIPFKIEDENGFLKIMVDFDSPICNNCPTYMRLRHYYSIMINQKNQLLVDNEILEIDEMQSKIENYLTTIGKNDYGPETLKQVNFQIFWNKNCNKKFLDSILAILYKSHLSFVEKEIIKTGKEICSLEKSEIINLKEKYPLRIEFDLGKINKNKILEESK